MWTAISQSLNATGNGPQKQGKEWQKTWRDWKSNVLKKCAQNKSYAGGTGGGPPKILKLTELEENLLEIIDPEAAGLPEIPEGGNFSRIKQKKSAPNDTISKRSSNESASLLQISEAGNFSRIRPRESALNDTISKRSLKESFYTNEGSCKTVQEQNSSIAAQIKRVYTYMCIRI
ncbi:uncharacterized protein LOC114943742 [Nylanderia fulva]|uniref:uncharacterized protein LOC114930878 n=1 Tax=Nylanderia fulva TaxID=613905 RepID=UPI0010FB4472|nr:uncharacterized protein LOC114930878 [Nylanderia fulva]XP_029162129.1 uncharacterized protein LOC114933704 [Nylanderia fulva]XP_029167432.1 uncharacterized protein LOC114937929 [Nylanderia fulva]XP_029175032.1 uncharacterized protein LOC114943554 [Nylanderia fulva]XP_029175259.1 uncharacterized protein LOC114943742 [Nylanderia fulva]